MGFSSLLVTIAWVTSASVALAETCPKPGDEISTERPDFTNSTTVVPYGSLQSEQGVGYAAIHGVRIIDVPASRIRLGVTPCLEVLVDTPNYLAVVRGQADSGFTNVVPALKWQIEPTLGGFNFATLLGVGLPTGTKRIIGDDVQPYFQIPWSRKLNDDWNVGGMATLLFRPSEPVNKFVTQYTFLVNRMLTENANVFLEYAVDVFEHGGSIPVIHTGALYRLTPTQQVDFHVGFGVNRNAPDYFVGFGYSFRLDGLFGGRRIKN